MKKIMIFMMIAFCSQSTFAQVQTPIKVDSVSAAAYQAFIKKFPDQKHVDWYKTSDGYRASFENEKGLDEYINYDVMGRQLSMGTELKYEDLPSAVRDYLNKNYPETKVGKFYQLVKADNSFYFETYINGWIMIDEHGSLTPIK